jgi:integrase
MESARLVDCAGRPRSPATQPGYNRGRPPRNKGLRYPPDPPTVEEIIAVMRSAGDGPDAVRLHGVIVVLWRAGLRVSEALALAESDLDRVRGAIQVRHGKGGRRREVGMDRWAWEQLDHSLNVRAGLPIGALFCVLRGPTRGRPCSAAGVRVQLRNAAIAAGVRRRFAPHQLRHAHAVEMSREGVPLVVIQRQLGQRRPRGHLRVLARDRQHRDRAPRPRAPRTDDPCGQRTSASGLSQTSQGPRRLARPTGPRPADPRRSSTHRPETPAHAFR